MRGGPPDRLRQVGQTEQIGGHCPSDGAGVHVGDVTARATDHLVAVCVEARKVERQTMGKMVQQRAWLDPRSFGYLWSEWCRLPSAVCRLPSAVARRPSPATLLPCGGQHRGKHSRCGLARPFNGHQSPFRSPLRGRPTRPSASSDSIPKGRRDEAARVAQTLGMRQDGLVKCSAIPGPASRGKPAAPRESPRCGVPAPEMTQPGSRPRAAATRAPCGWPAEFPGRPVAHCD